jgi:hypothetical protein
MENNDKTIYDKAGDYTVIALIASIILSTYVSNNVSADLPIMKLAIHLIAGIILISTIPAGIISIKGYIKFKKASLLVKGCLGIFITILFIASAIYGWNNIETKQHDINHVISSTNSEAPVMIDEITRLDSASLKTNDSVNIKLTITSLTANEVNKHALDSVLIPMNKTSLKNSEFYYFIINGYTITYSYFGKDNVLISSQNFSKKDFE